MSEENKDSIDREELGGLVDKENEINKSLLIGVVTIVVSSTVSILSVKSIFSIMEDKRIALVECPRSYENDSPVLLKTIKESNSVKKDKWIKGFARNYITRMFPRSGEDAQSFFKYLSNHSLGKTKRYVDGLVDEMEDIKTFIDSGNFYSFYAKNHLETRVRSLSSDEWVVEVDGYLTKRFQSMETRTTPTVRISVRFGDVTTINPEGLYVFESNIEEVTDYVSGRKK